VIVREDGRVAHRRRDRHPASAACQHRQAVGARRARAGRCRAGR
jgi:hypothetical protein